MEGRCAHHKAYSGFPNNEVEEILVSVIAKVNNEILIRWESTREERPAHATDVEEGMCQDNGYMDNERLRKALVSLCWHGYMGDYSLSTKFEVITSKICKEQGKSFKVGQTMLLPVPSRCGSRLACAARVGVLHCRRRRLIPLLIYLSTRSSASTAPVVATKRRVDHANDSLATCQRRTHRARRRLRRHHGQPASDSQRCDMLLFEALFRRGCSGAPSPSRSTGTSRLAAATVCASMLFDGMLGLQSSMFPWLSNN